MFLYEYIQFRFTHERCAAIIFIMKLFNCFILFMQFFRQNQIPYNHSSAHDMNRTEIYFISARSFDY